MKNLLADPPWYMYVYPRTNITSDMCIPCGDTQNTDARLAFNEQNGGSVAALPPFSLIRDFGKQTPAVMFPIFPSVLRVIDRSDRNPPITAQWHDVEKVRRSH